MKREWKRLEAWLQAHAPKTYASLNPGASAATLDRLAARLGFPLPRQLRAYLSIHNGQPADCLKAVHDGWILLSAESIATTRDTFNSLLHRGDFNGRAAESCDGMAKAVWWSEKWIPIMESPGGDYLVVDLDPAESGDRGQVTEFLHDDGDREVKARDLRTLLEQFRDELGENEGDEEE